MINFKRPYLLWFIFLGVLLFHCNSTDAQWYHPENVSKKVADLYAGAYNQYQDGKSAEAIALLNQAISIDPRFVDGYLSRADIYANTRRYDSSVMDYEKGIQLDSIYTRTYFFPYSISLAGAGKFQQALATLNRFLQLPSLNLNSIKAANARKAEFEFAINYQKIHPRKNYIFAPHNLGDSINSKYLEYYPSLTIEGNKMIFTRRMGDEDFYESDKINGVWSKAYPLGGKVNTNLNEGAQNISQDGEWIIFTGCNYPEGLGSCDLYISYKTENGWTEAENLGPIINTDAWESSPSLSPDKRDLYFSSDRRGGYGGKDIWVSHRSNTGKWSEPENLGPTINTPGDEGCAFMYPDNQTLFFNSNGHPGYGKTDLFFAKKLSDSSWSIPENLGYPVNTIDDEGSLVVAADGRTAYYTSDATDSRGGLDLYSFELSEDIRPPKTIWVRGLVFDNKTNKGLPATVEVNDLSTGHLINKVQTDADGHYLSYLPVGKDYIFNVNKKGYLFYSENFDLVHPSSDSSFVANIPLKPIEAGASIVLKNIFFDSKSTVLKPESKTELNKVVQLMNDNPSLKIQITGYTDNVGKPQDNIVLSNGRALSVMTYLLSSRQISKDRIQFKGLGASNPIADNATLEGKAKNRRTELSVIAF